MARVFALLTLTMAMVQSPCTEPPPAGFRTFDEITWNGPWVLDARTSSPFPSVDRFGVPLPIRFDDGTRGTVRVSEFPCPAGETCAPEDCGCFAQDRSRVEVLDAGGRVVSTRELWVAYSMVTLVAVDLTGGPGDELILVRNPQRASPPSGRDLKIWRLDRTAPVDLVTALVSVASNFGTMPVVCARWQARLSVDVSAPKPRRITIRHELGSRGCCQIFPDDDRPPVDTLRRERRLQFDAAAGRYVDSLAQR